MSRIGINVRFNNEQQSEMRELMEFWGPKLDGDPKSVIRFALQQLATSTRQLKTKIEQEESVSNESSPSEPVLDSSSDVETEVEPTVSPE